MNRLILPIFAILLICISSIPLEEVDADDDEVIKARVTNDSGYSFTVKEGTAVKIKMISAVDNKGENQGYYDLRAISGTHWSDSSRKVGATSTVNYNDDVDRYEIVPTFYSGYLDVEFQLKTVTYEDSPTKYVIICVVVMIAIAGLVAISGRKPKFE